jgi:uncharacterized protein (DUF305 family)
MKKTVKIFICLLLASSIASCTKDEDGFIPTSNPTTSHDSNKMIAQIHEMMQQMDTTDLTGNTDQYFAKMTIVHHNAAIDMANIVVSEGKDTTIRGIAQRMIIKQNQEISQLKSFLIAHPIAQPATLSFNNKVKIAMERMHRNVDLQYIIGNVDHDFATIMIVHHQSAIEMADLILNASSDTTIKNMANKMRDEHEIEIEKLQTWLLNLQ